MHEIFGYIESTKLKIQSVNKLLTRFRWAGLPGLEIFLWIKGT